MRRGELFSLVWEDVDFENRLITIRAFNTKMMRERRIGMTERLTSELGILYAKNLDPKALLFGISSVKRSFDKVRAKTGLSDLKFHNLRHTLATRLGSRHSPLALAINIKKSYPLSYDVATDQSLEKFSILRKPLEHLILECRII